MSIHEETYALINRMIKEEDDIENLREMALKMVKMMEEVEDAILSSVKKSRGEMNKPTKSSKFNNWFN